jgi:hypothetical protein
MEAFPPVRRLCERGLLRPAKLGEEPIRCKPLSNRCLPLSFGCSIMIASLGGVPGAEWNVSPACSMTMESIDRGSMVELIASFATSAGGRMGVREGPSNVVK